MADSSTGKIAAWVAQLSPASLSDSVREAATKSFANYVGCAIGGQDHEATQKILHAYTALSQGAGSCTVLGSKEKVDPLQAALVNSVASHIHDYDDTHLNTVIHPTGVVASALLAYVESAGKPISGADFITALFTGIEVQCLLGLAVYPSHYQRGWHITASVGSIGAAVAVGKAMGLTKDQLMNAIGIASTQVNGMRIHFGSHSKPLGVGFASQAGLQSAFLAKGGMTAASNSLDGPRGWIECVCPDSDSAWEKLPRFVEALINGRGIDGDSLTEMEKNSYKPYPCGIVIHPAIDGCSQLRSEGLRADDIESITLKLHPLVLELTGRKYPKDGLEAKFSVYFGAACGLLFGKATPTEYTDEVVKETATLRDRITATVDNSLRPDECHISVQTASEIREKHVEHAVGSLANPMSNEQFKQKFEGQIASVVGADACARLFSALEQIWNAEDVGKIVRLD